MDQNLFAALRREWTSSCMTAEAERAFASLVEREPAVAASTATKIGELVANLDRRSGNAGPDSWTVVAALIRQIGDSELVALGLLVGLIPTMLRIAERLRWGQGGPWVDREEFVGELAATTWDVLRELAGSTLAYPVQSVRRRVVGRLVRLRDKSCAARLREIPTLFDEPGDADERGAIETELHRGGTLEDPRPVAVLDSLAQVLCRIEPDVLERELVRIVYARRVLGYPIREISALLGEREDVIEYRARRAETLLSVS